MPRAKDVGVFQLENGNWEYRYVVVVDGKSVSSRKRTDEFGNKLKTKRQAIKAREAALNNLAAAEERKKTVVRKTFEEVFNEYCEKGRSDRAYMTVRKQDSLWRIHLKDRFGSRFIDEISVAEVNDYLAELYYKDGYAFKYVESFLKMFYLIFGQAYSRDYLSVDAYNKMCLNKDTKIHMPKLKVDDDTDIVVFTREETAALDKYFEGTNAETAYLLGRFCGLRIN